MDYNLQACGCGSNIVLFVNGSFASYRAHDSNHSTDHTTHFVHWYSLVCDGLTKSAFSFVITTWFQLKHYSLGIHLNPRVLTNCKLLKSEMMYLQISQQFLDQLTLTSTEVT